MVGCIGFALSAMHRSIEGVGLLAEADRCAQPCVCVEAGHRGLSLPFM